MNVDQQGGDSNSEGETTPASTQTDEPGNNQDGQSGGDLSNDKKADDTSGATQDKDLVRKAQESHRQVIDLVEDKFKDLDSGNITQDELQSWFESNKEFASVANRSKRLKERYRTLASQKKDLSAAETKQDEKKSDGKSEDKPLTRKDLLEIREEERALSAKKLLEREMDTAAEDYAGERKIQDEDFSKFKSVAKGLYDANEEWSWEDALEASHRALYPSKTKGVNMGGSAAQASDPGDSSDEPVDLSKGFTVKSRATE